jgi:cell division protein FtsZ
MEDFLDFDFPTVAKTIIKVIGVGGGGSNAVNHMYKEGIQDVTFMLCNTDNQALLHSQVPTRLQLGIETTKGLGAGNDPAKARLAAEESLEDIRKALSDDTRMVFITAGMGGGTGTGAAPVVAEVAKGMDILTVGIVTIPFEWEGDSKIDQALDGVEEMSKHVDALLVINNEQLRRIYPDLEIKDAFKKADDTLTIAAKSIAEIITVPGHINLDFADVSRVMKDGGVAIMSTGYGVGETRVSDAMTDAMNSPLLNNNDVFNAKKVLFNISCSETKGLFMHEMGQINEFMKKFTSRLEVIWGISFDNDLGDQLKVTLLATGFNIQNIPHVGDRTQKMSDEDLRKVQEANQKRDEWKRTLYKSKLEKTPRYKKYEPYVLTDEQMDNDAIIDLLNQEPANKRDSNFLTRVNF